MALPRRAPPRSRSQPRSSVSARSTWDTVGRGAVLRGSSPTCATRSRGCGAARYALAGVTAVYAGSLALVSLPASWDSGPCARRRALERRRGVAARRHAPAAREPRRSRGVRRARARLRRPGDRRGRALVGVRDRCARGDRRSPLVWSYASRSELELAGRRSLRRRASVLAAAACSSCSTASSARVGVPRARGRLRARPASRVLRTRRDFASVLGIARARARRSRRRSELLDGTCARPRLGGSRPRCSRCSRGSKQRLESARSPIFGLRARAHARRSRRSRATSSSRSASPAPASRPCCSCSPRPAVFALRPRLGCAHRLRLAVRRARPVRGDARDPRGWPSARRRKHRHRVPARPHCRQRPLGRRRARLLYAGLKRSRRALQIGGFVALRDQPREALPLRPRVPQLDRARVLVPRRRRC